MSQFKTLVNEARVETNAEVEFLLDHHINPSIKYANIPLYNPETDGLILLRGADKDSPYFSKNDKDDNNKKCFSNDKVVIQNVSEKRNTEKNYYEKIYGDNKVISVNDFMKIYNHPRNEETRAEIENFSLDTPEQIADIKNQFKAQTERKAHNDQKDFEDWVSRYISYFNLDDLSEKQKVQALEQLYKANKKGFKIEDLENLPIIWAIKNKPTLDIYNNRIKQEKDEIKQAELKAQFDQAKKKWFKHNLNDVDLLKTANKWWNAIITTSDPTMEESNYPKKTEKRIPINNPHEVKETLAKIGIDPKFVTVPIKTEPMYNQKKYTSAEEDPNATQPQELIVRGFPDQSKLDDEYGTVKVKDKISGNSFEMNIGELKELINNPINKDTELDTTDYRLHQRQQRSSLNLGMGDYVELPEDVIIEMLKTVNKEKEEFEYIDLVDYYKKEKESGIPNRLVTRALNAFNQGENTYKYVIRKYNTKDRGIFYRGFIPHDDTIKSRPSMVTKDKFKTTMDY